jgi:hypothetical protein
MPEAALAAASFRARAVEAKSQARWGRRTSRSGLIGRGPQGPVCSVNSEAPAAAAAAAAVAAAAAAAAEAAAATSAGREANRTGAGLAHQYREQQYRGPPGPPGIPGTAYTSAGVLLIHRHCVREGSQLHHARAVPPRCDTGMGTPRCAAVPPLHPRSARGSVSYLVWSFERAIQRCLVGPCAVWCRRCGAPRGCVWVGPRGERNAGAAVRVSAA